ncbi:tRNA methyltransferase 11 [Tyrophagus putrescentiae]|nr:tRNA methyltransferase 11 [Tyrophagus putrescentiae]
MNKRYMIRFTHDYANFRVSEFQSLTSYFQLKYTFVEPPSDKTSDEACLKRVLDRSILSISLYELWVNETKHEQFYKALASAPQTQEPFFHLASFRILVETFGKKISLAEKVDRIEKLDFLPFEGPIILKDPQVTFHYFEYFGHTQASPPENPHQITFGRWIADSSSRKDLTRFSLKTRKFIANTSMEPTLSFLMSNIAQVGPGDIVYDGFCGSGSILLAAAFYGAYICGSDIDYKLLHGMVKPSRCGVKQRDTDESVLANLKQHGLESKYLDVIAADSSLPLLRNGFMFDAILSDLPYGKRESRERIGSAKKYTISEDLVPYHIPSKLEYKLGDLYSDLLVFAAKHLKINGRLAFWAPYTSANEEEIPDLKEKLWPEIHFFQELPNKELANELIEKFSHPNLKFISFSKQTLTTKFSRILITMERIA